MNVMNFNDARYFLEVLLELSNVNLFRYSFHEDLDTVFADRDSSEDDDDGEEECTDGVEDVPGWVKVNQDCCK